MEAAPVRKSLLRRISWLGGDRRVVGVAGIACAALGWTMFVGFGLSYGLFAIIPALIFFGVLWVSREAYKADPFMIDVMLRQFKYRKYLAPKCDVGQIASAVRDYTAK